MDARISKEARSLMPAFAVTLISVVTLSLMLDGSDASGIVVAVFAGCCALMGAVIFGNEFQASTMPLLLAQPVPRQRMWSEKMLVLGIALAVSCGIMLASIEWLIRGEGHPQNLGEICLMALGVILCAFCATPGLTLKGKSTLIGFAISLTMPFACILGLIFLAWLGGKIEGAPDLLFAETFEKHPRLPYFMCAGLTLIYCAITYWLGRKVFMRFEAIDGQGPEIALPAGLQAKLSPALKRFLPACSGPIASLVRKELLLQRVSFIIAGAMCLVAPLAWLIWKLHQSDWTTACMILSVVLPAILIPVITGAVTLAEERNWGTVGWQLTLPVSPLKQWLVKMGVAYSICLLLGVVLALLLAEAGYYLENGSTIAHPHFDNLTEAAIPWFFYLAAVGMILFGSSASANSVRAVLFGLGLAMACGISIGLLSLGINRLVESMFLHGVNLTPIQEWLDKWLRNPGAMPPEFIFWIVGLLLLAMLNLFTLENFRSGDLSARRWKRQTAMFLIVLITFAVLVITIVAIASHPSQDIGSTFEPMQRKLAPQR